MTAAYEIINDDLQKFRAGNFRLLNGLVKKRNWFY